MKKIYILIIFIIYICDIFLNLKQNFLKKQQIGSIIYAENIAAQSFGAPRLRALPCSCVIDGFAKMPLQASIFASWYNIRKKSYRAIFWRSAPARTTVRLRH